MGKISPVKVISAVILAIVIVALTAIAVLYEVEIGQGGLSTEKMKNNISKVDKICKEISYSRPDNSYEGEDKQMDSFVIERGKNTNTDETENGNTDVSDTEYLCSYSADRLLTEADINELKNTQYEDLPEGKDIIQMVINEMYARHGYEFNNEEIQAYFNGKKWYQNIEERNDSMDDIYNNMSDIERKNVDFISEYKEG